MSEQKQHELAEKAAGFFVFTKQHLFVGEPPLSIMNGNGKDVSPSPVPSGPGRGRPKKVRPRENEDGSGTGISAEVKRRRKSTTVGGETGESGARLSGPSDEKEINVVELKDPDPPVTRSGARSEKHPMNKRNQNAVKGGGNDGGMGSVHDHSREVESQEEGKDTALDVVLKVHGVCAQAIERAATFPGETGQETGGHVHLCSCCMKPEVLKQTLVCDACERSFHVICLKLALQFASELDDWICTSCSAVYPESEVADGVSKVVREGIERKLFSQEGKTCVDECVQNELRGTVCCNLDRDQSVVLVAASSEQILQDLNKTNGPDVSGDDQPGQGSSNHSVLPERALLDLNEVSDRAVEGSFGRNLRIDLNECRDPEFEEEVLTLVDGTSKLPEAEVGTSNDSMLSGNREAFTNLTEINSEQSPSKPTEASERVQLLTTEEFSVVRDVVLSSAGGNFTVRDEGVPFSVVETCVDGIKLPTIAEDKSMFEVKLPGTPEICIVPDASRSTLLAAEPTVENEKKLTFSSVAEELTTVADRKLPATLQESKLCNENKLTDFSSEHTVGNEEKLAGRSVGGDLAPGVEIKLLGSSAQNDILITSRSVIPSAGHTAAEGVNQAFAVVVATDADNMAVEGGRLVSADSQEVAHANAREIDMLLDANDVRKCITADDLGQDGKVNATKHSDRKENRPRKNGGKLLDHFQEGIVARPSITGERMGILESEPASQNARPTFPFITTSPTSSADVGVRAERQQSKRAASRTASPVSHADRASCTNMGCNGSPTVKSTEETSPSGPDDRQLKKIGADTLQQLRDSIREKHGLMLADGWEVEVRRRRNEKHLDKYYISPEKHRFRSRIEVMKHLGLWDSLKCSLLEGSKGKCEEQQSQSKEWLTMVHRAAGGNDELQLPLKLGELTIESLGVIDLRPGYWDELHIWPVGYRCTWHDLTTSSFCVSEVADGGSSAPIFRVTRKYCSTVAELTDSRENAVNVNMERSDMAMKDLRTVREDIMAPSADRMSSYSHGAKSQYGSGFDVEEEESLKALLGDIGSFSSGGHYENVKLYRDSKNLDETSMTGTEVVSQDCVVSEDASQPRDLIGQFSVEALSTAEAWRLYAEQFVVRCQQVSDAFGSILKPCPHKKISTVGPLPSEISDPQDLLEKFGEDRFGLNQTLVIGLIETLPNSEKCSGYKTLKQRGLSWKAEDPVEVTVQPPRFRIREKARKQKKSPDFQPDERVVAAEPIELNGKDEVDAPILVGERPPPPYGQSLELRLPSQYVGDVLQIWEFLSRFFNLIGFSQPPMLKDLEEGLVCGSSVSGCVNQRNSLNNPREIKSLSRKKESDGRCDVARDVEVLHARSATCDASESPQTPMKSHLPGRTYLPGSVHGYQQKGAGRMESLLEDDGKAALGGLSNSTDHLIDIEPNHDKGEAFSADAYTKSLDAKLMGEPGLTCAASVHVPLIKFLISDLQSKVCGFEELAGESEESKHKRGRKRIRDIVAHASLGREKLVGFFSINELTWPEVARRYILSLSRITKIGETAEYRREECMKILRCIQGDGGVLCGALDGVAGMEIDAQLLAEAEKEISTLMHGNEDTAAPATPPQNNSSRDPVGDARGEDSSGECALWVKLLDPIAKLPTNVGSRIRNRVIDALAANPPAWAAEMLEYSISKKVYKGNASGPTKRAVMEVLQRYRGEDSDPKVKKTKKQRKRVLPSPEVVMQRCRIVLRQVATADTLRVVSKSYRCMTNFYESEGEGLLARPLDFRAIDLRLGAGAYGTSPDAFAADVKQIWKNVAILNENGNVEASAAIQLAELFQNLYNKQVILFQRGGDQPTVTGREGAGGKSDGLLNEESQKNATEEKTLGSDANKPVKAPWEDDSCQVCGIDDDHDNVLLCDGCDAEYHIYCLNPPLPEVPDGNWFCHSCVAVHTGFLEAPSAPESITETKTPDKQDEHHQMREHYLEEIAEKDQLRKSEESTLSSLPEIVLKLAETDYWHLTLAERVHLLKWLCDQALETPKLRSHLEKSMEVAQDLQQKLRTLLAERRKNADLDEARPDSGKEVTREVSIISVLQTRGAISKRTDEFDEEISVQVDVVDGLSVPGPTADVVGTSRVVKSDPTKFVGPRGHGAVEIEMDTPRDSSHSHVTEKRSLAELEEKDVTADQSWHNPLCDPVDVDLPKSAVRWNCGQLKEGSGGETRIFTLEGNFESDDLKVVDPTDVPFADRIRKNAESPVRANPQTLFEPRNLSTSFDEGLESKKKCPKDGPLFCPGVEVEIEENNLQRNNSNVLDAEIEKIKTKLMLLNSRRDLLGRDDIGRIYWALCGSKTTPWLAVETSDATSSYQHESQEGLDPRAELGLPLDSCALFPSVEKLEMNDVSKKQDPFSTPESTDGSPTDDRKKEIEDACSNELQRQHKFSWFIYANEAVLDQLIEWLSPTSNQERLLKATLLQWKSLLLLYRDTCAEQTGGLRGDFLARFTSRGHGSETKNTQVLASQDVTKNNRCVMPVLKASSLLEWKHSQHSDSFGKVSSTPGGSKRGRKRKMQQTSKISRCDCLEPLWSSRCHCMLCHTTYESEVEFHAHTTGGRCSNAGGTAFDQQGDVRQGKKPCHNSNSLPLIKSFNSALPQQSSAGILALPDFSKLPMIVHESLSDRINRIGCIADKGPLFAPALAISPAFDPALMMVDSSVTSSSVKAGVTVSALGILGTLAVGGVTSCMNHGEGENLVNGYKILVSRSEILPGQQITEANSAGVVTTTDRSNGRSSVPTAGSYVPEHNGPFSVDVTGHAIMDEVQFVHNQSAVSAPILGSTVPSPYDLPYEPNSHLYPFKGYCKNFKVTGKQLTIREASLRPLEAGEDLDMLQQLKAKLLDIEAAVTPDMSENARAYPRRRRAWRSMLKFAKSIYTVVQAIILLEQMICADFLRTSWCYWSSLTVAAKTATLSSLYLRVYALDAAIAYEKSEIYAGADLTNCGSKQGRQEKEREDKKNCQPIKPPRKKKKEEVNVVP